MSVDRSRLYRFPWSMTDNPGGWVEVTDHCDLSCTGCYHERTEGHRRLSDVFEDIDACRRMTNCDSIKISGGEPLLYPHLADVVRYVAERGMKPFIITNGVSLDKPTARELVRAGLKSFSLHIDSAQGRRGWAGRSETDLNELRESFADLIWEFRHVTCSFVMTVTRGNLPDIGCVAEWALRNIHKVGHLSFIALRGIALTEGLDFYAAGRKLDPEEIPNRWDRGEDISITSEEMLDAIRVAVPRLTPSAYIAGTSVPASNKYLVAVNLGARNRPFGSVGPRTIEMSQVWTHLVKGKYAISGRRPKVGRRIFLLSGLDPEIRKSFFRFLRSSLRTPAVFFSKIYTQSLALEQPMEVIDGETNACDGCINMMIHRRRLIPSCRLEEYRRFGSTIQPQKRRLPSASEAGGGAS